MTETLGIIDMGSNSVRLILVRIQNDLSFRLLDEHKESIRLGDGFTENMTLLPSKVDSAVKTMSMFKRLCDAQNVTKIIAVATAAVRKAKNGEHLIKRIKNETGIEMKVISGEEEAYLDFLAVSNSFSIRDALILDIGGGSFELIHMKDRKAKHCISISFGSIDLAEKFNIKDPLSKDEEKKLKSFLEKQLEGISWLKKVRGLPVIGVGGTMRNIGKMDMMRKKYPIDIIHAYQMNSDDFYGLYNKVKKLGLEEKKDFPGLSADRADIFTGSASLVNSIMNITESPSLIISGKGVREGLFYQHLLEKNVVIDNPLMLSLENTAKNMGLDLVHSFQIRKLTKRLFEHLQPLHNIKKDVGNIIDTASLLHDSGVIINYYNHHRNSFFVILNSQINGLSHRELVMSAYIASFHRKNKGYDDFSIYSQLLDDKDIEIIKQISVMLRIAESLDKSMSSIVSDLFCTIDEEKVMIKILASSYPEIEIMDALTSYSLFKKMFGRAMIIA